MISKRSLWAGLAACAIATITAIPAFALDRSVRVVNNTGFTIVNFYGSNKGSKSWEEDILGSDVLGPGQSVNINFDDGSGYCKFDFKAIFNDGEALVSKNINICEIGTYNYN